MNRRCSQDKIKEEKPTKLKPLNALTGSSSKRTVKGEYPIVTKRKYIIDDEFEHIVIPVSEKSELEKKLRRGEDIVHLDQCQKATHTTT